MKQILLSAAAACLGAIAGITFMAALPSRSEASATPRITRTRQLEVVDENGRVTARIRSENGRALLEFLSNEHAAIQIGIEQGLTELSSTQFVRLLSPDGRVVAANNALPPDGAATLYLGDARQQARIIMGAFVEGDIVKEAAANDWGIQIRQPRSPEPLLTILARTPGNGKTPTVALRMHRSDGRVWTEY
jgi:hypothetical protein